MIKELQNHFKKLFHDKRGTRLRPKIMDVYTTSSIVEDQSPVAVTAVETVVNFTSQRKSCLIYNAGPNDVHFSVSAGVTVNNFVIPSLDALSIVFPVTSLYFICAAGQTCTIYILGER